jgi:hypothetical protein
MQANSEDFPVVLVEQGSSHAFEISVVLLLDIMGYCAHLVLRKS